VQLIERLHEKLKIVFMTNMIVQNNQNIDLTLADLQNINKRFNIKSLFVDQT